MLRFVDFSVFLEIDRVLGLGFLPNLNPSLGIKLIFLLGMWLWMRLGSRLTGLVTLRLSSENGAIRLKVPCARLFPRHMGAFVRDVVVYL